MVELEEVRKVSLKQVRIVIKVQEGPPTLVEFLKLRINGKDTSPWHPELMNLLPLKVGKRFRIEDYKKSRKIILRFLSEWGYPKAKIDQKARIFRKTKKARVFIDVDTGPVCIIGNISVRGLNKVERREIFHNLLFKIGDRFQASKIKESQKKLFDTQLFSFVDIEVTGLEDRTSPVVGVLVRVEEAKPYTVRSGFGYGTEDKLRGRVELEARRFFGDGRRLKVYARGSFREQSLETSFIQPHLFYSNHWFEWKTGWQREDQEGYKVRTFFSAPRLNLALFPLTTIYAGHNLEFNKLDEIYANPDPLNQLSNRQKDNYFISSLVFGTTREKVDNPIDPSEGYRIYLRSEWASQWTGSEASFIKASCEVRKYTPFMKRFIVGMRAKWGTIVNLEDSQEIPIFKKFFAGGGNSIRGYPYQKLGPLDSEGNPLGGESVVEANFDFRFPVKIFERKIEGVLFFDFGQVAEKQINLSLTDFRYTTGFGIRYKTPIGPLRLDLGYQLNPPDQDFFGPFQFYFSIGQAF